MIDLHSHLLPGVDDGSRTVDHSVFVLKDQAKRGIADICLTPHLSASDLEYGVPPAHDAAFAALKKLAPASPRLHRGAEVMLDRPLSAEAAANPAFRLGGGPVMLVEFPRLVALDAVSSALRTVVDRGVVPLLAHPERYSCCSPAAVARWRELGSLMQLDATTLLMPTRRGDRARALLAYGMGDIVAGDNHGDDRCIGTLRDALTAEGAPDTAELLTRINPSNILEGKRMNAVPPFKLKLSIVNRVKRLFWQEE